MLTLREELRETICRHVRVASHDELVTVVVALMAELTELPEIPAPAAAGDRFQLLHDDQVVLDRRSGLMWSRADVTEKSVKWEAADKACRELRLAGYGDWRLPTVDELFALADRTRADPAIDTEFFPACKAGWYWSSTPYAPSPGGHAWYVYFDRGYAYAYDRDSGGFVRAVRASQ